MTQNAETKIKNGKEKHKEHSIEYVKKNRIAKYTYYGKIQELPIEFIEQMYITKYKGEIKNRKILKWVPLINTFGEASVQITGGLSVIIGISIAGGSFFWSKLAGF